MMKPDSLVPRERTRGNGPKLKYRKLHLTVREKPQVTQRACGVTILGDIKHQLDVALGIQLLVTLPLDMTTSKDAS